MSGEKTPQPVYFTQEDPIGLAGGMNLYGYAGGDPINNHDPFGLKLCLKGDVAAAASALKQATNTDFKLLKNGCVNENSIRRTGASGFGAIQGRFNAIAFDENKHFTLSITHGGDARGGGNSTGGRAFVGVDVTGRAYARPGDGCKPTQNWDLASVVVHELLGHAFAGAYASARAGASQESAIAIENRYHAATGRELRDPSCG